MKKFLALVLAAMMLVACLSFASAEDLTYSKSSDYDASGDAKITLVFTANASGSDYHGIAMTKFADAVADLSGGSVECKVYSDSTLFSSDAEWDAICDGSAMGGADMAYISFATLSTQPGLEWCAMVASAYFWASIDHMTTTLNGSETGAKMFADIEAKTGLKCLGAMYLGSRVINTRNREINSYADMSGLLLRMPGSEAWQNLGRALGAEPTALAFSEVYTSLSTGAIDAQDNPLPSDITNGFYEVATYFAITNHVVDSIIPMMNGETWASMTEAQQAAVTDAMNYAIAYNDAERIASENEAVEFLLGQGCTVTYPDINDFRTNAKAYYEAHPEQTETWDWDLYNEIQALAE